MEMDSVLATDANKPGELKPMLQLQLIARGAPIGAGEAGISKFMDLAHFLIVNSFADLTTKDMHTVWGRTA